MTVFLVATLDTKGAEAEFVRQELQAHGAQVCLVDVGCIGTPEVEADVTREEVFAAAGTSLEAMVAGGDRGEAVTHAAQGAKRVVLDAFDRGECSGVLSLGGSAGTTIGTTMVSGSVSLHVLVAEMQYWPELHVTAPHAHAEPFCAVPSVLVHAGAVVELQSIVSVSVFCVPTAKV